jgi:hypothetical protein
VVATTTARLNKLTVMAPRIAHLAKSEGGCFSPLKALASFALDDSEQLDWFRRVIFTKLGR